MLLTEGTDQQTKGNMKDNIVIVGGGIAGMEAARQLLRMGLNPIIVEKSDHLGGHVARWHRLFPDMTPASELVGGLIEATGQANIFLNTEISFMNRLKDSYNIMLSNGVSVIAKVVLITTGFSVFDASKKEEYGYGVYDRVMTNSDLEQWFNNGNDSRIDGTEINAVGFVHCVGSRDEKARNSQCSKVCCITAVKQAMELRELLPDAEILCFYMDMRMFGPGYEEMYREAQEKYNIKFVRGRLSEASENQAKQVVVKCEDTLVGKPMRMTLDLMVLMVGMEASDGSRWVAKELQLPLAPNGFIQPGDPHYATNRTAVEGVFVAGCATSPMNLTDTLTDARSAALAIGEFLNGNEHYN